MPEVYGAERITRTSARGMKRKKRGATGKQIYRFKEQWKPNIVVLKAVIKCVKATQQLQLRQ